MKLKFIAPLAFALLATACSQPQPYQVTIECGEADSTMVYIQNYFTGELTDSIGVSDGKAVFTGETNKKYVAQVLAGEKQAIFILEPGNITVAFNPVFEAIYEIGGTFQNDSLSEIMETDFAAQFMNMFRMLALDTKAPDFERVRDSIRAVGEDSTRLLYKTATLQNPKNEIGDYCVSMWLSSSIGTDEFEEALQHVPSRIKQSDVIKKSIATDNGIRKNQPGAQFIDFTIENGNIDGTPVSLSDYVGKGKYVLVDFWASWCAPCRGGIPGIKKLYEQYREKGLEVVSVAVWDERSATLKALEEENMPWPQIIDAQDIPSKIYGFTAIPQVILFSPNGTLIARDLHGKAIDEAVAKAFGE